MRSRPLRVVKLLKRNEEVRQTCICGWVFSGGKTMDINRGNLRIYGDVSGSNPIDKRFENGVIATAVRRPSKTSASTYYYFESDGIRRRY